MIKKLIYKFFVFFMFFSSASSSFASVNWQMGFNESVTTVMNDIVHLHDRILLPIIVAISVFVLFLLLYSIFKFRASKNPMEELMKLGLKLKKKECIMVNVQSYVDLDMHSCQSL